MADLPGNDNPRGWHGAESAVSGMMGNLHSEEEEEELRRWSSGERRHFLPFLGVFIKHNANEASFSGSSAAHIYQR